MADAVQNQSRFFNKELNEPIFLGKFYNKINSLHNAHTKKDTILENTIGRIASLAIPLIGALDVTVGLGAFALKGLTYIVLKPFLGHKLPLTFKNVMLTAYRVVIVTALTPAFAFMTLAVPHLAARLYFATTLQNPSIITPQTPVKPQVESKTQTPVKLTSTPTTTSKEQPKPQINKDPKSQNDKPSGQTGASTNNKDQTSTNSNVNIKTESTSDDKGTSKSSTQTQTNNPDPNAVSKTFDQNNSMVQNNNSSTPTNSIVTDDEIPLNKKKKTASGEENKEGSSSNLNKKDAVSVESTNNTVDSSQSSAKPSLPSTKSSTKTKKSTTTGGSTSTAASNTKNEKKNRSVASTTNSSKNIVKKEVAKGEKGANTVTSNKTVKKSEKEEVDAVENNTSPAQQPRQIKVVIVSNAATDDKTIQEFQKSLEAIGKFRKNSIEFVNVGKKQSTNQDDIAVLFSHSQADLKQVHTRFVYLHQLHKEQNDYQEAQKYLHNCRKALANKDIAKDWKSKVKFDYVALVPADLKFEDKIKEAQNHVGSDKILGVSYKNKNIFVHGIKIGAKENTGYEEFIEKIEKQVDQKLKT